MRIVPFAEQAAHRLETAIGDRQVGRVLAVGRRVEDFAGLVEAKPPGVVARGAQELQFGAVRLEAENALAEAMSLAADDAIEAGVTDRGVDPVIESQPQVARPGVGVVVCKPVNSTLRTSALPSPSVSLRNKMCRRLGDDQAAVGEDHAGRDAELVGEDGELVGLAVAVGVLGDDDAIAALAVGCSLLLG